jgi:hypothetical protein
MEGIIPWTGAFQGRCQGPGVRWVKEIQMANGKEQMANVKPFEFCHLPFEIALCRRVAETRAF